MSREAKLQLSENARFVEWNPRVQKLGGFGVPHPMGALKVDEAPLRVADL
jgi:hypothetical protein